MWSGADPWWNTWWTFFVQCLFIIDGSVYNFYSMCQHLNDLRVNVMVYAMRGCSGRWYLVDLQRARQISRHPCRFFFASAVRAVHGRHFFQWCSAQFLISRQGRAQWQRSWWGRHPIRNWRGHRETVELPIFLWGCHPPCPLLQAGKMDPVSTISGYIRIM